MNDKTQNGLDTVFAADGDQITVGGETLLIGAAKLGQIARALKTSKPLVNWYVLNGKPNNMREWLTLAADESDAFLDTAAALVSRDRSWIESLDPEEGIRLAVKVFKANFDFFMNRLPQALEEINVETGQIKKATGQDLSSA